MQEKNDRPEKLEKQEKTIPQEYPILKVMSEQTFPMGAGALREVLHDQGISISEAGIGRILRELRRHDLLERVGFQGHTITERGLNRLNDLEKIRVAGKTLRDFLLQNNSLEDKNILDILIARRALEREAAAQAALRATPADIRDLENIIRAQYEGMEKNEDYADLSTAFHRKILQVARSPLLQTLYEFIGLSVQWQGFFIGTFKMYNQPLNVSHEKILSAIKERDPEKASLAMSRHLGDVISNAQSLFLYSEK